MRSKIKEVFTLVSLFVEDNGIATQGLGEKVSHHENCKKL